MALIAMSPAFSRALTTACGFSPLPKASLPWFLTVVSRLRSSSGPKVS